MLMLVPYTADLQLGRLPWLTLAVCVACVWTFVGQETNRTEIERTADRFCASARDEPFRLALSRAQGRADVETCQVLIRSLHEAPDREAELSRLLANSPPVAGLPPEDSEAFLAGILERAYQRFARNAPPWAERKLMYWPSSLDPRSMIASSFAHADWEHLVFNLFFFVAFAATVEVVVGPLAFAAVGIGASISSGLFYSLTSAAAGTDIPSLGLSDVVMAMMCLLAFLLPEVRIRCAWWFLLVVGRIALPAWLLALWFVGGDAILLLHDGQAAGGINLVAHVAGGAFGFVAGALFLQRHKRLAREHATQARLFAPPRIALLR